MAKPVRIKHKEYGTVLRITSVVRNGPDGLMFRAKDETYGDHVCFLDLDQWATGNWVVVSEEDE